MFYYKSILQIKELLAQGIGGKVLGRILEQTPETKAPTSVRANSRHIFDGHAPLNLPLPVWTKTTLPPDTLQRRPVGTPHGQWPFHTASGQSGSPSSPWSNTHHHHHHHHHMHTPLPSPLQIPRTWWCCLCRLEPLSTLRQRCVWSPRARGVGPGLIRSTMMKWAERPQPQPAPASNHSSLNWQGSSRGPIGVKSWITFSFLSLSNYPHPPPNFLSVSLRLCMARLFSLLLLQCPLPTPPPSSGSVLTLLLLLADHTVLYCLAHQRHQSLTPTTYSCQSPLIPLSIFPCCSPGLFLQAFHHTL